MFLAEVMYESEMHAATHIKSKMWWADFDKETCHISASSYQCESTRPMQTHTHCTQTHWHTNTANRQLSCICSETHITSHCPQAGFADCKGLLTDTRGHNTCPDNKEYTLWLAVKWPPAHGFVIHVTGMTYILLQNIHWLCVLFMPTVIHMS